MSLSTRSDGSDDLGSSDLTSYYCIDCDTRHDLGPNATPYVCDSNRNFGKIDSNHNFGNIDANRDYPITRVPALDLARYQIYAIDPATGQNIPDPRRSGADDAEASNSNQVSVTQAE